MGHTKNCFLTEKISLFQKELNDTENEDILSLESKFEELKCSIAEQGEEHRYRFSINLFDRKLGDCKKEMIHQAEIDQLEDARKDLETRVLNIQIPVVKNPGSRFEELRKDAAMLEVRINTHCDNCYAIANLRQAVKDIKEKIELLDEDNKIFLGWTGANTVLSVASIGVAFIPLVGLPIAAVMVGVPYLGKLTHRLAVSHNRKKKYTKEKLNNSSKA